MYIRRKIIMLSNSLFSNKWKIGALILMGFFTIYCYAADPVPAPAAAASKPVGEVVWIKGKVEAVADGKQPRSLKRKDAIYEGDTINSAAASGGQVVFTDGGLLALRENTAFKIDQYKYDKSGNPSENKYVANLVKGGFRTITGAISKGHPENYRLSTPVATIGVRGTQYSAYCGGSKDDQCNFKLEDGTISVSNEHGDLVLNGQSPYGDVLPGKKPIAVSSQQSVFGSDPEIVPAKPSAGLMGTGGSSSSSSGSSSGSTGVGKSNGGPVSGFTICP